MMIERSHRGAIMFGRNTLRTPTAELIKAVQILEASDETIPKGNMSVMLGYKKTVTLH